MNDISIIVAQEPAMETSSYAPISIQLFLESIIKTPDFDFYDIIDTLDNLYPNDTSTQKWFDLLEIKDKNKFIGVCNKKIKEYQNILNNIGDNIQDFFVDKIQKTLELWEKLFDFGLENIRKAVVNQNTYIY